MPLPVPAPRIHPEDRGARRLGSLPDFLLGTRPMLSVPSRILLYRLLRIPGRPLSFFPVYG